MTGKVCGKCGYVSHDNDLKCPICGGHFSLTAFSDTACDPQEEKKWNNSYHNDFEEGRKTGEYCDPKLEKYTNRGAHYHGNEEVSYNEDVTYNEKVSYLNNEIPIAFTHPAIVVMLTLFFRLVYLIALFVITKDKTEDEQVKKARKISLITYCCTVIPFVFQLLLAMMLGFSET